MQIFYLMVSLLVLSQSAIFIRLATAHAVAIGFWRMAIALPVLFGMLVWHKQVKDLKKLSRKQWLSLTLCGFFLFAHFYSWFLSVQKTTVANSMILFAVNPLCTAVGAWFLFREPMLKRQVLSVLLCLAGVFFLLRESLSFNPEHLTGDLLGIVCAIFFSAYVLTSKGLRQKLPNLPFAFVTYSVCLLCFFVAMLAYGLPFLGYSAQTWFSFSGLAFGSTLLGHSLFTYCLQFFPVNFMSIATLVEPIFTALSGYWFFGEKVGAGGVLGFVFVALGIFVLLFRLGKRK